MSYVIAIADFGETDANSREHVGRVTVSHPPSRPGPGAGTTGPVMLVLRPVSTPDMIKVWTVLGFPAIPAPRHCGSTSAVLNLTDFVGSAF